jgi:hypothetical protein
MWPTWADIVSKEMPEAEFYNFGLSGCGNQLISYRIAEANNRYQFCDTDLIMVMFTTYTREDRWTTDKGWIAGGNIYNNRYYPDSWVREFADERGYLIRDAAIIDLTIKYLENVPSKSVLLRCVPFVSNSDNPGNGQAPYDIMSVYQNTFNKLPPSMFELELRNSWRELEHDYKFGDGHPNPQRYYNYLSKLGMNLTDRAKQFAAETSQLLSTIEVRNIVPVYFPEQDNNVTNSIKLLF